MCSPISKLIRSCTCWTCCLTGQSCVSELTQINPLCIPPNFIHVHVYHSNLCHFYCWFNSILAISTSMYLSHGSMPSPCHTTIYTLYIYQLAPHTNASVYNQLLSSSLRYVRSQSVAYDCHHLKCM